MDFKKKKVGQSPAKYLVLLFCLFPVTSSINIDCNGKAFNCLNATHFSICVDFGFGMSITIDDFAFPCPQETECHIENQHECEIIQTTTLEEINELTTESLHITKGFISNSLLTTESTIFTTNDDILVSNNKSIPDENVVPASTTEITIQRAGTQGYFTDDPVTPEDVTMNTVAVVTMAHTTEPITKKRTFAERDLTNVSYNKSIDLNETLNVLEETYRNTKFSSNSEALGEYTTTKTTEGTQGIKLQTEVNKNNYNENTTPGIIPDTQTTAPSHRVNWKEETLLETTIADTFIEEKKEITVGNTIDIFTNLSPINTGEGLFSTSEVNSANGSTKKSKVDEVTETTNLFNENSESILPNLKTVTDILGHTSDILHSKVTNESTTTENSILNQGVNDIALRIEPSNMTKPQFFDVNHTSTKYLNEQVNTDPYIQSTNLFRLTRTDTTTEKGVYTEESTYLPPSVTTISETSSVVTNVTSTLSPILEVKNLVTTTDIPSLGVNNVNVSSSVAISSERNIENTGYSTDKEVSNLDEEEIVINVTSIENSSPNLNLESISTTISTNDYEVTDIISLSTYKQNDLPINEITNKKATTEGNQKKIENYSTIQLIPTSKFNITDIPYQRNETSTEISYSDLKLESKIRTQYLGNNKENYTQETTSNNTKKLQGDKKVYISAIKITPTFNVTEKLFISSKDQNTSPESIINKVNTSSKIYTTSVYTTVDERPNVQEEKSPTPTRSNTEKYSPTNSNINSNVNTAEFNKVTRTTNAYLSTTDSKYLTSATSVEALSDIETPKLAPSTKDIQMTTTESYKLIENSKKNAKVSTVLTTNSDIQKRKIYPESNMSSTENKFQHAYTQEGTISTNLQRTTSSYSQGDIYLTSIKFRQSTVKPTSRNQVSSAHSQNLSKANFVTEKGYIDESNHWKVLTPTPTYTVKSYINNTEIISFYKENIGSNINPIISTSTQDYVNIIPSSETQHGKIHTNIVNSSTEKATFENPSIVKNVLVQKTIVDIQDDTVTRDIIDSKNKAVKVATKYITSPVYMGSGQMSKSTTYSYVTKGVTIGQKNPNIDTISNEKGTIQGPVRSSASTEPTTIPTNVNYQNSKVMSKKNNVIVTKSEQNITTSNLDYNHKQSQLSTQTLRNEVKGETGHDSSKQNEHSSLVNNNQTEVISFNCSKHKRGKFGDSTDCRKFYICIGLPIPMVHYCPNKTVFSERNRQCTKNISHCVRNNEFRCTEEGRFRDYLRRNVYYLCVNKQQNHFNRYKLQCREGFYLDKDDVKCIQEKKSISLNSESSNVEDKSKRESSVDSKVKSKDSNSKEKKDFRCEEEGKFPHPKNCKKYYTCEKKKSVLRRKKKRCDSHEIFDKESSKCVSSDSYECED